MIKSDSYCEAWIIPRSLGPDLKQHCNDTVVLFQQKLHDINMPREREAGKKNNSTFWNFN